jgi:succinylarginine dihydrolase
LDEIGLVVYEEMSFKVKVYGRTPDEKRSQKLKMKEFILPNGLGCKEIQTMQSLKGIQKEILFYENGRDDAIKHDVFHRKNISLTCNQMKFCKYNKYCSYQ